MKAAIYTRVSTDQQHTENQTEILQAWAHQRGFSLVTTYSEAESAWKAGHQNELAQLIRDARRRKFEVVLVWALDRLSREGPLAILSLVNRLNLYGVNVISYQESWTEAPGYLRELLLAITGWVAQMESQRRSERTKAGMERARRQGKRIGRPPGSKDRCKRRKRVVYTTW